MIFSVRQHRQFLCGGFAWTLWVECSGVQLGTDGQLGALMWDRFWQWITNEITPIPNNAGVVLMPCLHQTDQSTIGELLECTPESMTAERLAALVFDALSELSSAIDAVTVLRQRLSGHADDTIEATARRSRMLDESTVLNFLRVFANMNGLAVYGER